MANINPEQLTEELTSAGLPVVGCDSLGSVWYSRTLTPAETTTAAGVIAAHDPVKGTLRRQNIAAAQAAAAAINGVDVTTLTLAQCRTLLVLLAADNGWIRKVGAVYQVNVQ